jgi:hypothetical protein
MAGAARMRLQETWYTIAVSFLHMNLLTWIISDEIPDNINCEGWLTEQSIFVLSGNHQHSKDYLY